VKFVVPVLIKRDDNRQQIKNHVFFLFAMRHHKLKMLTPFKSRSQNAIALFGAVCITYILLQKNLIQNALPPQDFFPPQPQPMYNRDRQTSASVVAASPSRELCGPCRAYNSDTGVAIRIIECGKVASETWGYRSTNFTECTLDDMHQSRNGTPTTVFRSDQQYLGGIFWALPPPSTPIGIVLSQDALLNRTICATPFDVYREMQAPDPDWTCYISPQELAEKVLGRRHIGCGVKGRDRWEVEDVFVTESNWDEYPNKHKHVYCCYVPPNVSMALETQAILRDLEARNNVSQCEKGVEYNQFDIKWNISDVVGLAVILDFGEGNRLNESELQEMELARQSSVIAFQATFGSRLPPTVLLTRTNHANGSKPQCQCLGMGTSIKEMVSLTTASTATKSKPGL
jgi:hypothetical protein